MNFSLSHPSLPRFAYLVVGWTAACILTGCSPTINLATPNPIKVDVGVRLDVYQKTAPTKAQNEQSSIQIAASRRLRLPEIKSLKSQRIIGEDRDGYLDIRNPPKDDPKLLAYVEKTVEAENNDRSYLYLAEAQAQNEPFEQVEQKYGEFWTQRALPGEWIQKENGTWIQK